VSPGASEVREIPSALRILGRICTRRPPEESIGAGSRRTAYYEPGLIALARRGTGESLTLEEILGLFNRSTKPSDDLIENGIKGRATVEKAHMGTAINYSGPMREKSVEQLLSGETSMTRYKLDLRVELPGREPYSTQATVSVPMAR
jgi:hypothetical protein